jgi:inner membrane protein
MASFGHVAVGLAAGRLQARDGSRLRSMLVLTALSMFPDLDVVTWWTGMGRHSIWLHRGALHSLAVSVVAAVLGALLLDRRRGFGGAFLVCLATAVSHPLLDTITHGGSGVMLFWPVSEARFLAPWHPLPATPIGPRLLSPHGLGLLAREAVLFAPLVIYALWPRHHAPRGAFQRSS